MCFFSVRCFLPALLTQSPEERVATSFNRWGISKCAKFVFFFTFLSLICKNAASQSKVELFLYDKNTNQPVVDARVSVKQLIKNSDTLGLVTFSLPEGICKAQISHPNYRSLSITFKLDASLIILKEYLEPLNGLMKEVIISGRRAQAAPQGQHLTSKDLESIPVFMGQNDPLRLLQTLPGTAKGGDGNAGLFVRGGTSGQNLTLLNHAVVYNPSHLLGFFSVFNGNAVNKVNLYKSGIPSEYGGRLSSVMEVSTEGKVFDSLSFKGNVGLLAADVSLTVPINHRWSVNTSFRKTFMGLTIWPALNRFKSERSSFNDLFYDFFDGNLNSTFRLNTNNYFSYSGFISGDDFSFGIRRFDISNSMDWHNVSQSLSWKSYFKPNTYLTTIITSSAYGFNFGMSQDRYKADIASRIFDYSAKSFVSSECTNHQIKTGIEYIRHKYQPNIPEAQTGETIYDFGQPNIYHADESSLFASDNVTVSSKASIYGGLRFTHYRHLGPYSFTNANAEEIGFSKNNTVSSYTYLEPSIGARYGLRRDFALKTSFSYNTQPVHLISVTAVNFPTDFWMPSVGNLKPQKGYQGSLGVFYDSKSKNYEAYIDLYYKQMKRLAEFSGGLVNLVDNLKIEEHLYFGKGEAYGAEFYLKKKSGRLNGWLSYTLAKNNRNFSFINNGNTFPAKYDRRHDFSLVSNYKLSKRWSVNSAFTYATGNTYTKPVSRYMISGNIINEYGPFNGSRMPAYHRLDFSATYLIRNRWKGRSEFVFSVYNVYNRQNPVYIYFMAEGDIAKYSISISPKSVSVLPVLPSINYKYSF